MVKCGVKNDEKGIRWKFNWTEKSLNNMLIVQPFSVYKA